MAGTRTWRPALLPRQTRPNVTEVSLERIQQTRETEGLLASVYYNATSSGGDQLCSASRLLPFLVHTCTHNTDPHTQKHTFTLPVSLTHTHFTHAYASPPTSTYIGQQGVTQTPGRRAVLCSRCPTKLCHFAKSLNLSGLQEVKMRGQTPFSLSPPLFRL